MGVAQATQCYSALVPKRKANKLGCIHPRMVRRQRAGFWDAVMYGFNLYPWQCRLCGCRVYSADRRSKGDATGVRVQRDATLWSDPGPL